MKKKKGLKTQKTDKNTEKQGRQNTLKLLKNMQDFKMTLQGVKALLLSTCKRTLQENKACL
jgi:hypothetical protein